MEEMIEDFKEFNTLLETIIAHMELIKKYQAEIVKYQHEISEILQRNVDLTDEYSKKSKKQKL
jgi:hypothetical protein